MGSILQPRPGHRTIPDHFGYLGFGTCFELEVLLFFWFAAFAFACFCAACLCVAFGDLSPMAPKLRSKANGVNTDTNGFQSRP
jgi:hypothetical protein